MPTVIQSSVLPYQPTMRDKLLEAFISAAPQFLMTGLTGGFNMPKVPNPNYGQAGDLKFPSGASTPTTPQELQQIIQRGGVPTTQGTLSPYQNTPSPFANQRNLGPSQLKALSDLQSYQQSQTKAPYELRETQAKAGQAEAKTRQINWAIEHGLAPVYNELTGEYSFRPVGNPSQPSASFYQTGDIVERGRKRFRIVGTDADGMPLVEPE